MRIQHNIMAMSAYRNYTNNVAAMKKNLEKLSSGYKINRAGDDAAGLAISEKMRAQITGLETAQKLIDFLLHLRTVGGVVISAVGGLGGQLHHTVEHIMDLSQSALSGLHQADAVLGVLLCGFQTGDLGTHFFGNRQTGSVVTGAVDLVAGGQPVFFAASTADSS